MKKNLFYTSCPNESEFHMLLESGGCLDYAMSEERSRDKPVYLSDSVGLIWVADYVWSEGNPILVILLDPVFSSQSSLEGIAASLQGTNYSVQIKNSLLQKLRLLPVLSMHMINS